MKDKPDCDFSSDQDFNFEGGLVPKLTDLFADRRKECGDAYGKEQSVTVTNRSGYALADSEDSAMVLETLDLSCFDESDPTQLTYKLMRCSGAYLGFRGIQEHTNLHRNNLE